MNFIATPVFVLKELLSANNKILKRNPMQALGPIGRNQEEITQLHSRQFIIRDHIGLNHNTHIFLKGE